MGGRRQGQGLIPAVCACLVLSLEGTLWAVLVGVHLTISLPAQTSSHLFSWQHGLASRRSNHFDMSAHVGNTFG